jgi:tRNA (guanine-N7-)-methyltransferase
MPLALAQAQHHARAAELVAHLSRLWPAWPDAITLEIGCGHGHFLAAYAQAHPGEYCLGVDLLADRIRRAQKKAQRAGLPNLAFLQAEARLLIEMLPEQVAFRRIFVLFPDPWPKRRHHKHRLLQPGFLKMLAGRAGEGAHLCFRTDYEPYYLDAVEVLRSCADWQLAGEPWPFEFETVFQSRAKGYFSCVARRAAIGT